MPSVVLIPTGQLEFLALATALRPLFPSIEFVVSPPDRALDGFTSLDVQRYPRPPAADSKVSNLAGDLIAAVSPGRRGRPADFAVVVEDLELANDHQPHEVVQYFRQAVSERLASVYSSHDARERASERIRERCSFHLFRPMTEAYFFGDADALQRAAIQAAPQVPEELDWERFQIADAAYLALPAGTDRIPEMPHRARHPKGYLQYLCDPTLANRQLRYRETQNGVRALSQLDWQRVLANPTHCPFLRAFLDDLAFAAIQTLSWVERPGKVPTAFPGPSNRILRNI